MIFRDSEPKLHLETKINKPLPVVWGSVLRQMGILSPEKIQKDLPISTLVNNRMLVGKVDIFEPMRRIGLYIDGSQSDLPELDLPLDMYPRVHQASIRLELTAKSQSLTLLNLSGSALLKGRTASLASHLGGPILRRKVNEQLSTFKSDIENPPVTVAQAQIGS